MQIRNRRLYAVNPENGYFGVVPGTSYKSNSNAMKSIAHDTIYTNVALTDDGDVWWEGKDGPRPAHAVDWRGNDWTPESKEKAAHPNSRFTTPMRNNPALDPNVEKGEGVPISAIIFGGRRSDTVPLVYQAFDWDHGVYLGATMASETTAAATGAVGQVRRDPMAMLPFCGYNIGDYFRHWLDIGKRLTNPPLIFNVNWFRKGVKGQFLWPGFGENMRVLKWIINRCEGTGGALKSPIGWLPSPHDLDLAELDIDHKCVAEILGIDHEEWQREWPRKRVFRFAGRRCARAAPRAARTTRHAVQAIICRGPCQRPGKAAASPTGICTAEICESLDWQRIFPVGSKIGNRESVPRRRARTTSKFAGRARTISKALTSIFRWGN